MKYKQNFLELIINHDLLNNFCEINNFIIITDTMLQENNMYKNLVYTTSNNFVGMSVYPKDMPLMMNKETWQKLIKINNELKLKGFCIKIYDAYRPIEIQKIFWESFYNTHGYYDETLVATPNKYGTHNITINAIDILLANLDGTNAELPCEFDDFSEKANIYYNNCTETAKHNRDLLISTAQKHGLLVNIDEWWHFFDDRLKNYGMKYNYSQSNFIPLKEDEVFTLKKK